MSKRGYRWLLLLFLLLTGCAVVQHIHEDDSLKVDSSGISDDLVDKFAVKDAKDAKPDPTSEPTKKTEETQKKSRHHKKSKHSKKAEKKAYEFQTRRTGPLPFHPGERTVMTLTYLGVEAGTLDLRVLPYKYIDGRKVVHLRGQGLTTSVFALFYRVNDIGESFMDFDGLFTHKFQLKVDESLQQRDLVELYDQKAHEVHYWEKIIHKKKGLRIVQFDKDLLEYTQDAVTAAFYLRTLPLEVGKTYRYPVVSNGSPWEVEATVLRKEELVTPVGTFPAIVIQPETRFDGILKKTGDAFFWLSDDEHRSFLKIDAKVKIGKVIAYLKELEYGKPEE